MWDAVPVKNEPLGDRAAIWVMGSVVGATLLSQVPLFLGTHVSRWIHFILLGVFTAVVCLAMPGGRFSLDPPTRIHG